MLRGHNCIRASVAVFGRLPVLYAIARVVRRAAGAELDLGPTLGEIHG